MSDREILESYIPIADYIQSINCGNSEVLIHDLSRTDHSVIYIAGNVTNRKPGAPLTQYAADLLKQKAYEQNDYISGYIGKTNDGRVIMRSSTLFIRNEKREPIGLLCVNIDVSKLVQSCAYMEEFIGFSLGSTPQETTNPSPEHLIEDAVRQMEQKTGVSVERFSKKQKLDIVRKISDSGLFRLKGAVRAVAQMIRVSEKTLYRYISELEASKADFL